MEEDAIEDELEAQFNASNARAIENAYSMRKFLDTQNLGNAIGSAIEMLSVLRHTKMRIPQYLSISKQLLKLGQHVTVNLKFLEKAFLEESKKGRSMSSLYSLVQQTSQVLPRLYLLISLFIDSREVSFEGLIEDFAIMLKGVQHPLKALVMRSLLLKKLKERNYERENNEVTEAAVQFYTDNLECMAKLWSRLQYTGYSPAETPRLMSAVTENIRLISTFPLHISFYQETVLPLLLGQVKKLRDKGIKKELVGSVISSFPEIYHLYTLTQLLDLCVFISQGEGELEDKWTLNVLLSRLTSYYASASPESLAEIDRIDQEVEVLALFKQALLQILEDHGKTGNMRKLIELVFDFVAFSLQGFSNAIPAIDAALQSVTTLIFGQREDTTIPYQTQRRIEEVLIKVIDVLGERLFELDHFIEILDYVSIYVRKAVAKEIVKVLWVYSGSR